MSSKTRITLTGLFITAVILFTYISLRSGMIEKEYVRGLIPQSDRVVYGLRTFEKDKGIADKNLTGFLSAVNKKYQHIAAIAIADASGRVVIAGKNDRYIENSETLDTILNSFTRGEFTTAPGAAYTVRYYNQIKFYAFVKEIPEGRLLMLFPYRLKGPLLIKLLLELLLMLVVSVIVTAALYLLLSRKKRRPKDTSAEAAEIRNEIEISEAVKGPAVAIEETAPQETAPAGAPESKPREEPFQNAVEELFSIIYTIHSPESIALFTGAPGSPNMTQIFEQRGNVFIKIETPGAERIQVNNELGNELKNSASAVLDRGRKALVPVAHGGVLLGIVRIARDTAFKGMEIQDIKTRASSLGGALHAYISREAV